jgi:hypothetical protein
VTHLIGPAIIIVPPLITIAGLIALGIYLGA